jgi:hypothetical protein
MRRLRLTLLASFSSFACGDDGGSGSGSATGPGTSASASEGSGAATQGTGTTATAGGTATGSDAGSDGVLTTGVDTTAGDGDDTGSGLPTNENCRTAADCVLDDDCCHCALYGGGLPDPHACADRSCPATTCEAWGIPDPEPTCVQGNCLLPKVSCDGASVTCDEAPPACDGLQAPQIVDGCYTQACIPLSSCEEVAYFSCDECEAGQVCVRFSSCAGDSCTFVSACLPDPGAAVVNCATAGDVLCGAFGPGFACHDEATGPYCCTGDAGVCANAG